MRGLLALPLLLLAACQSDRAVRKDDNRPAGRGSCASAFPGSLFPGHLGRLQRQESRPLGEGQGRFYVYGRPLDGGGSFEVTVIVLPADPSASLEQSFDVLVQQSIDADREALGSNPKLLYKKKVARRGRLTRGVQGRVLSTPKDDPLAPSAIADHYLFQHGGCALSLRVGYPTARERKVAPEVEQLLSALE